MAKGQDRGIPIRRQRRRYVLASSPDGSYARDPYNLKAFAGSIQPAGSQVLNPDQIIVWFL